MAQPQELADVFKRRPVDFTGLSLDNQQLPVVYVQSRIIWKSDEPAFLPLIEELEAQPQPGFFLTPLGSGDKLVRVRRCLNRHCVFRSDLFRDSGNHLYRDVDAKGVGYTRGFPIRVVPIRNPEMQGDLEARGVLHNEYATEERLIAEEISLTGARVARHVAHIELFELVAKDGRIVPRQEIGEEVCYNFESLRPTVAIRAMGTTARVWDLPSVSENPSYLPYAKEIVDDALLLLQSELGEKMTPAEYAAWFVEMLGRQVGILHRNGMSPDFRKQIHQGTHNVTLDCRLTDTHRYDTPQQQRRQYERDREWAKLAPQNRELFESIYSTTPEEVAENNAKVEKADLMSSRIIVDNFLRGVDAVYPIGSLIKEGRNRFDKAYAAAR